MVDDIEIHHSGESKNNSENIAECDDFICFIDSAFLTSDQALGELKQALALKKRIHVILIAQVIKKDLPQWILELKATSISYAKSFEEALIVARILADLGKMRKN